MKLILNDFECGECGRVEEHLMGIDETPVCEKCGCKMHRIISQAPTYQPIGNQDTGWLKTIHEVMDKDNPAVHVQEMLKNPTRDNYKKWMKGEGVEPMETGEKPAPQRAPTDTANNIMEMRNKRRAVEVSTEA